MKAAISADRTQIAHSGPPVQVHTCMPAAMHIGGSARLTDVLGPITQREASTPAAQIQSAGPVLAPTSMWLASA
jgi:hypothetical protein